MILLNFAHPISSVLQDQIEARITERVYIAQITVQLDLDKPFADQIVALVEQANLTPEDWQTEKLLINPPGLAPATACILAEIHGRTGYFPTILRLKQSQDVWTLAEIIDLHIVRNADRT